MDQIFFVVIVGQSGMGVKLEGVRGVRTRTLQQIWVGTDLRYL